MCCRYAESELPCQTLITASAEAVKQILRSIDREEIVCTEAITSACVRTPKQED